MDGIPEQNYQSRAVALEYDRVRLTGIRGMVLHFLEG